MAYDQQLADALRENEQLRAIIQDACEVLRHYGFPEHAFHYERVLAGKVPLTVEQKEMSYEEAMAREHGPDLNRER